MIKPTMYGVLEVPGIGWTLRVFESCQEPPTWDPRLVVFNTGCGDLHAWEKTALFADIDEALAEIRKRAMD